MLDDCNHIGAADKAAGMRPARVLALAANGATPVGSIAVLGNRGYRC
jgi:hypothetical protein